MLAVRSCLCGGSMRKAEPQHRAARALRRAARGVQCSDFGARLVRRKRMAQVHGARRCLTFELSGPPAAWLARRIIDNESRAGQAVGGSALERRVRQHPRGRHSDSAKKRPEHPSGECGCCYPSRDAWFVEAIGHGVAQLAGCRDAATRIAAHLSCHIRDSGCRDER